MNQIKKLKRSQNKLVAGVCAGIAEYFEFDVTLVRIIWALSLILAGTGLLAYIICLLLMPTE